jgi:hypothetical protein
MRVVALARFRLLTIVRKGTPMFVIGIVPPLLSAIPLSVSEPVFRVAANGILTLNATVAMAGWLLHGLLLSAACLTSGKVKTLYDDVALREVPDLMDTAPVAPADRFHGEVLGTFGAGVIVHAACLPLLAAVASLSPLPLTLFTSIEAGTIALLFLASAGAAWQRRAPRTRFSGTRGARNAALFLTLAILAARASTAHWETFRDAFLTFVTLRASMRAWNDVVHALDNPPLLFALLSLLYAGNIAYYFVSSTRTRVREN